MGIWSRHAGVLFHLLHLQLAACGADRFLSRTLSFLLHTVGNLVPASTERSQGILITIPSLLSPDSIMGGSLVKWKSFSLADEDLGSGPTGSPNHCVP